MIKKQEILKPNQEIKQHVKGERQICSIHQDLGIWRIGGWRNLSNQSSKIADGSENEVVKQNFISHTFK